MSDRRFIDSNVLLYLLSGDAARADRAELAMTGDTVISVQVLNEMTSVARRKLGLSWEAIAELLGSVRGICSVEPLTVDTNDRARLIAERYQISMYDALIVATALIARCGVLYSEDLQDQMVFEKTLTVRNPFR